MAYHCATDDSDSKLKSFRDMAGLSALGGVIANGSDEERLAAINAHAATTVSVARRRRSGSVGILHK